MKKTISTRTPFRLCLTGASDLIPYVEKYGGDAFGATIDKFVTVTISRIDAIEIRLSYPGGKEKVKNVKDIKNPIIREALIMHNIEDGVEIISETDIPPGSGLGSSGAFSVGLLNALSALDGTVLSAEELAEKAAYLEIERLKAPIGKHDQYMTAHGGFLHLEFKKGGRVSAKRLNISEKTRKKLEQDLILVYSGIRRSASEILKNASEDMKKSDAAFADITNFRNIGNQMRNNVIRGDIDEFIKNMPRLMAAKKTCFPACFNEKIENILNIGLRSGARSAKIVGAGGGGFLYFYVPKNKQANFRKNMQKSGATIFPFTFVDHGSIVFKNLAE